MEHALTCNNLKCRRELGDRALVTTCSHIFCLECAQQLGVTGHETQRRTSCPACNSQLANPDDAVITNLNPSEDYKTSVLSGLSPNIIMECAGRALSFWAYQTTQDIYYQQYLYKTLTDKFQNLSLQMEKTVNEANSEIGSLQHKLNDMGAEHATLQRKNEELSRAFRDKGRKLLQTQELYDKVKRKAEMGQIQRAASDAVDSSLVAASQATLHGFDETTGNMEHENRQNVPIFNHQNHRFDASSMNTSIPRAMASRFGDGRRWPGVGTSPRPEGTATPMGSTTRQRLGGYSFMGNASYPQYATPSTSVSGAHMPQNGMHPPSFPHNRAGLAGVGLTSGLKVSQPMNVPGLDASMRGR